MIMSTKTTLNTVTSVLGATFVVSALSASPIVNAEENPFVLNDVPCGYMLAGHDEGKCGEGKCGGKEESEGKCGEGKCGGDKESKESEGKCGEGKCGG